MTEGICPSGWHIPSDEEFTQLTDFLGGESVAGGKMKEAGYDHWIRQIQGLLIQAVGLVYQAATATPVVSHTWNYGYWWSASESGSYSGTYSEQQHDNVYRLNDRRSYGFSARCVRD